MVMYNGIPYQREQLDPDELETVTMQKILETTSIFQRAVYLVSVKTGHFSFEFKRLSSGFLLQDFILPR